MAFLLAGEIAEAIFWGVIEPAVVYLSTSEGSFIAGTAVAGVADAVHHAGRGLSDSAGVADDNEGESENPSCTGGGVEEDHPKVTNKMNFVVHHSDTMELVRTNEHGPDLFRQARIKRVKRGFHHLRRYAWEYGAGAAVSIATGVYKYKRRYRDHMRKQEADFQQRAIRHAQLRHYAPQAVSGFETPQRTPEATRKRRAHTHAFQGFRFTPRRY